MIGLQTTAVLDLPGRHFVIRCHEGDHVTNRIEADGGYERELLARVLALNPSIPADRVFVDAGANIGTHSIFFAVVCKRRVVAFEPQINNYALLATNVTSNGLPVETHFAALGDAHGVGHVVVEDPANMGRCRFVPGGGGVSVPVLPLDAVRSFDRVAVGLLKVDVEGMDAAVLRGAARLLARDRPVVIAEAHEPADLAAIEAALGPDYVRDPEPYCATPTFVWLPREPRP